MTYLRYLSVTLILFGVLILASHQTIAQNPMLRPDSSFKGAATDKTDLGANFDINGVIARATSGIPDTQEVLAQPLSIPAFLVKWDLATSLEAASRLQWFAQLGDVRTPVTVTCAAASGQTPAGQLSCTTPLKGEWIGQAATIIAIAPPVTVPIPSAVRIFPVLPGEK